MAMSKTGYEYLVWSMVGDGMSKDMSVLEALSGAKKVAGPYEGLFDDVCQKLKQGDSLSEALTLHLSGLHPLTLVYIEMMEKECEEPDFDANYIWDLADTVGIGRCPYRGELLFYHHLYLLLRDAPIYVILHSMSLGRNVYGKISAEKIGWLYTYLDRGQTLSEAMRSTGFNDLEINVIHLGEKYGDIESAILNFLNAQGV